METTTPSIEIRENFTGYRGKLLKSPILEVWVNGEHWTDARSRGEAERYVSAIRAAHSAGAPDSWYGRALDAKPSK